MGFSISLTSTSVWCNQFRFQFQIHKHPFVSFPVLTPSSNERFVKSSRQLCLVAAAARSQSKSQTGTGPVKKRSPNKKKKKKSRNEETSLEELRFSDVEIVNDDDENYPPMPLPKPPAGFVVDDTGRLLMASNKRIATIVDSTNGFQLECVIRRVFTSSRGDECMLLCPVDMPVQILKSTNFEGWSAVYCLSLL